MSTDDKHILKTREMLFQSDDWISADDLDRRLRKIGFMPTASELQLQGRVFGLHRNGINYFAAYQFGADCEPLPIIREILARLEISDCWAIAAWFHFANSWISPSTPGSPPIAPKNALNRRDEVLLAAERFGKTYVA